MKSKSTTGRRYRTRSCSNAERSRWKLITSETASSASYCGGHRSANDAEEAFGIPTPPSTDGDGAGHTVSRRDLYSTHITSHKSLAFYAYQQASVVLVLQRHLQISRRGSSCHTTRHSFVHHVKKSRLASKLRPPSKLPTGTPFHATRRFLRQEAGLW